MSETDDILQLFVVESREHLDGIVENLLQIEENKENLDVDLINQVFRPIHSIKGGAGFFGLEKVQSLAHSMESILSQFRQAELIPTPEIISVLLNSSDLLTKMINNIDASSDMNISDEMHKLQLIIDSGSAVEDVIAAISIDATIDEISDEKIDSSEDAAELSIDDILAENQKQFMLSPTVSVGEKPAAIEKVAPANKKTVESKSAKEAPAKAAALSEQSIRVNINLLDKLMVLAGELVLTRNELIRSAESQDPSLIQSSVQNVNVITSELQEAIMSTRMQTVSIVFNKFKRVVRDLSGQLNKSIKLEISGEDVDMDKTIIEAISDPLTHLIRNSVDHGIEMPADRVAKGKAEQGSIRLHAYHTAGQVVIEIKDDGAGINFERVKEKALENSLHSQEELAQMSDKEIAWLIFKPGFSTAKQVTDVSGRGVGMDVVQQNLSKVGGVVDIDSVAGQGTCIRIKLPLTLAIIPSLLVQVKDQFFAIPQINLIELVRVVPGDTRNRLESLGDTTVLRIRGEILPIVKLSSLLDIEVLTDSVESKDETEEIPVSTNVVIVATGDFKYGIEVDELLDSAEIVVKPLGKHFNQSPEYAGATILGDGSVAFILDIAGVREALELRDPRDADVQIEAAEKNQSLGYDHLALLLIENAKDEHFAVPLQQVTRIEKIARSVIQQVGNHQAINYRQGTLQLISIESISGCQPCSETDFIYIIVFSILGHEIGLIASKVKDIVDIPSEIDDRSYIRPGIMGSVVLGNNIVQLIEPQELLEIGAPGFSERYASENTPEENDLTVLLVEDSPFFLRQIQSSLEKTGFNVLSAVDGVEGLEVLEAHPEIQIVVSDIEMPRMNGLEMVREIRAKPQWRKLPIVAVTSLAGASAERDGLAAGFTEYQVKMDHEQLTEACTRLSQQSIQLPSSAGLRG